MPHQNDLPDSALALVAYVDQHARSEASLIIIEVVLASTHPDFVMSLVSACGLPSAVRRSIAGYLNHVLIHGLTDDERQTLFAWAQEKMLAGP